MVYKLAGCILLAALIACGSVREEKSLSSSSAGHPQASPQGSLVRSQLYPEDWAPGFNITHPGYEQPLFLQDYSYAG